MNIEKIHAIGRNNGKHIRESTDDIDSEDIYARVY